jgi:hypothetical protein
MQTQALVHHGQDEYPQAVAHAAAWARNKFEGVLAEANKSTTKTLEYLDTHQPEDIVVSGSRLHFNVKKTTLEHPELIVGIQDRNRPIHRNALIQIAEKGGLPSPTIFSDFMNTTKQLDNFARVLNTQFEDVKGRFLVRSVDDQVRGFLSDKYRRLDSRPMIAALIEAAVRDYGAKIIEARVLDTSVFIKMVLPIIFEPVPGEVGMFGMCFRTSDFGHGSLWLKGFFWRLWCTNLAMTEDSLRQVHLGGRLGDDIKFSERTMKLDTETMASAIKDVTSHILEPHRVEEQLNIVKLAYGTKIDADDAFATLLKKNKLSKGEVKDAKELFSSADVENLPPGQTCWRLSNAISLLAQQQDPDRKLELENLAGEVAGLHSKKEEN